MTRIAKKPINIPAKVEVSIEPQKVSVKGDKGTLSHTIPHCVALSHDADTIVCDVNTPSKQNWALAGTTRSLINNMIIGVSVGFEKKLQLVGVGYRAQTSNNILNLTLGFSHPVEYKIPDGIKIETPTQTEIIIKGIDKQVVGQTAAVIRHYRPPEPYKGKGVRYFDEHISLKETKKK